MNRLGTLFAVVMLVWGTNACRSTGSDDGNDETDVVAQDAEQDFQIGTDQSQELTGNERWVQPPGTARLTFYVDDRANQTFQDGQIIWTGSFSWNSEDNTLQYATSWLPTDGPYPLLYDDGPVADGGHEMAGAEAGDHIFSTEVYFLADEERTFDYGVLNELLFWMWEGPNGQITVPQGSTETFAAPGLALKAFGTIDLKVTVDLDAVNAQFDYVNEWESVSVYLKGSMNMWTPIQILDMGPDLNKGDEVAGDGVFTFVHGLNLGLHTGLLDMEQDAQFTVMFSRGDETWETAVEYKLLSGGIEKGVADGIRAYLSCDDRETWIPAEVFWAKNSWGNAENTTVTAICEFVPECDAENDDCPDGEKCIEGSCEPWCDLDEECGPGEKCIDNQCKVWCDLDEDCAEGQVCTDNACVDEVINPSNPTITAVDPTQGPTEGGTALTLTGSEFMDGAQVTLGGIAATGVLVESASTIHCTAPAHAAGQVDVKVTNPDGGTDTYIKAFAYIDLALAPVVTSLDPAEGPLTGGTQVHVYGENFLPSPSVFFGSAPATGVQFVDSTHVLATTPAGALGAVNVRLVNSDAQEDTLEGGFTYIPNFVNYARLLEPTQVASLSGFDSEPVSAEAWEPLVTPGAGAGPGLTAQIGVGPVGVDPSQTPDSFTWTAAGYAGESGNNDLYQAVLTSDVVGDSAFTFRFSMDGANWVYADASGNGDGFQSQDLGQWTVADVGSDPYILSVTPAFGTVLGGTEVTVKGINFDDSLTVTLDGTPAGWQFVDAETLTIMTAEHAAGPVDLVIENSEGAAATRTGAFTYVLQFTPSLDGELSEWPDALIVGSNALESNWGPTLNYLETLYLSFDDTMLYVGVRGGSETSTAILGYLDVDFGAATGVADMTDLSDNSGNGDLDDALSNVLSVPVDGFGAEFAFGALGMESYEMGGDLGDSLRAGWRELTPVDNFAWIQGTVAGGDEGLEFAIPLNTLIPGGTGPSGTTIALFVRLSNKYGGGDGVSNQSLPEYYNVDVPAAVGKVVAILVRL